MPTHGKGRAEASGEADTPDRRVRVEPPPSNCFGCSGTNASGLGLRIFRESDRLVCDHVVAERFEGGHGVVHGGVQAAMLDEVMCAAVTVFCDRQVVTGELTLRYRRPCPVAEPVRIEARVTAAQNRFARVAAEIRNAAGERVTTAEGKFFYR